VGISLKGKTVLVTGASSGIGQAAALEFAKLGTRILQCARREDRLKAAEPALREAGAADVLSFSLDVQNRDDVEGTLNTMPDAWGDIDILVNNAGLSRGFTRLWQDDVENWEEMIDTNIKGLLYVTRVVVERMVARGSGHVINLGSIAGHQTYANGAVYCASKAAVKSISEGLKLDLLGTPVRVSSVDAGMVETEFSVVRFRGDEDRAARVYQNITPLQPEDVADAIVWVATRPPHVNIHDILMTTIDQGNASTFQRRG
jgi:NADP-dependent 3-hydroxy acid dehydrogenase YdfG